MKRFLSIVAIGLLTGVIFVGAAGAAQTVVHRFYEVRVTSEGNDALDVVGTVHTSTGDMYIGDNSPCPTLYWSANNSNPQHGLFLQSSCDGTIDGTTSGVDWSSFQNPIRIQDPAYFGIPGGWSVTGHVFIGTMTHLKAGAGIGDNMTWSSAAPSPTGTGMSFTAGSGNTTVTWSLTITTANAQSAFTLGLPTAAGGWNCLANSRTNPGSRRVVMSAMTATAATLTQYIQTTGLVGAFADNDVIDGSCSAR